MHKACHRVCCRWAFGIELLRFRSCCGLNVSFRGPLGTCLSAIQAVEAFRWWVDVCAFEGWRMLQLYDTLLRRGVAGFHLPRGMAGAPGNVRSSSVPCSCTRPTSMSVDPRAVKQFQGKGISRIQRPSRPRVSNMDQTYTCSTQGTCSPPASRLPTMDSDPPLVLISCFKQSEQGLVAARSL